MAVLTLGCDVRGRQQRRTARFDTREQAEAWLKRQIAPVVPSLEVGEHSLSRDVTGNTPFAAYLETWLSIKKRRSAASPQGQHFATR